MVMVTFQKVSLPTREAKERLVMITTANHGVSPVFILKLYNIIPIYSADVSLIYIFGGGMADLTATIM